MYYYLPADIDVTLLHDHTWISVWLSLRENQHTYRVIPDNTSYVYFHCKSDLFDSCRHLSEGILVKNLSSDLITFFSLAHSCTRVNYAQLSPLAAESLEQ